MFERRKAQSSGEKVELAEKPMENRPATVTPKEGKTIIGEKITIEGDIRGQEDLIIEGSMKGKIELETHQVIVGPKGRFEGEIHADNVTISGHLMGNIFATGKVQITRDADFTGEIKARTISVEDGAFLKAVIELEKKTQKAIPSIGKAVKEETQATASPSLAAGKTP